MTDRSELNRLRADRTALAKALEDAGATVSNGKVNCPFHPDKTASGSIHKGDDDAWRFTCHGCSWNEGQKTGDVLDVVMKTKICDFKTALVHLGLNGQPRPTTAIETTASRKQTPRKVPPADVAKLASEAGQRLLGDDVLLETLWQSRAVDRATVALFGVGVTADRKYWTFPVSDGGSVVAVKHHRVDPGTQLQCFWSPTGTDSKRSFPVYLDADGPVWLCPGELKALAVIAAGRSAVGITGGEHADLPDGIVELLAGRVVVVAPDDDDAGHRWLAEKVRPKLESAGIEVCQVDLGLDTGAGLNDIGDRITSLVQDGKDAPAIAATLDHAFEQIDPWRPFTLGGLLSAKETWAPVEHVPTGFAVLDGGLGGGLRVGGVHLLAGRSGYGKTQVAAAMALNAALGGHPAAIVSLELARRDMAHLVAAQLAGIRRSVLAQGKIPPTLGDRERLDAVIKLAKNTPLVIADDARWDGALTRSKLANIVKRGRHRFGWKLVVLDYLGLLANERDDRGDGYAIDCENSAALKRISQENEVALVVVVALRKQGRSAEDKPITLDDILGAGRIGYDALTAFGVESQQAAESSATITLTAIKTRFSRMGSQRESVVLDWAPEFGALKSPGEAWRWERKGC